MVRNSQNCFIGAALTDMSVTTAMCATKQMCSFSCVNRRLVSLLTAHDLENENVVHLSTRCPYWFVV